MEIILQISRQVQDKLSKQDFSDTPVTSLEVIIQHFLEEILLSRSELSINSTDYDSIVGIVLESLTNTG